MKSINTYGMKMIGIKKAARNTKWLSGEPYSSDFCQISYDISTGEIWTGNYTGNSYGCQYTDANIVSKFTKKPCTM